MNLRNTVHAVISQGDRFFVAECMEIPVVTQGLTVDETLANLREAMALHLQDEDLAELGLPRHAEIDRGTLRAVLRQASRFVSEEDLRPHFYQD